MGCALCTLSSFFSVVLESIERISMCTVCAILFCFLTFTILTVLAMGIGIGYHYCFVNNFEGNTGSEGMKTIQPNIVVHSVDRELKQKLGHRIARRQVDTVDLAKHYTGTTALFNNSVKLVISKLVNYTT